MLINNKIFFLFNYLSTKQNLPFCYRQNITKGNNYYGKYKLIVNRFFSLHAMSKKLHSELDYIQGFIDVRKINPSPYQHRRYFDEEKLKELAASIQRDGLIEPIIVRSIDKSYQLIAGERRLRAVRDYTEMETIQAQIVIASNLQARRIAAAENLQREALSSIETIEAIAEIVDAELIENTQYASMGKKPADRVKTLLGKLDSVRRSEELDYEVASEAKLTSNKFIGSVQEIFENLPKPLKWLSFYLNDLPLLMDFCKDVQDISIKHNLNKSQTRALAKLKKTSDGEFQRLTANDQKHPNSEMGYVGSDSSKINVRNLSAREIEDIADKAAKKERQTELSRARVSPSLSLEAKIFIMNRLGIPVDRIASRLKVNRKTVLNHVHNSRLFQSIRKLLEKRVSVPEVSEQNGCPEPLVWSIALEGKSDQNRFESLNWGLRTWDHWYFNALDQRFGDEWPGQIPAQLVAHTLYYFTQRGDLVFDPMAGGGVVPDTCLAFNRRCWSFDLVDRPETRPEIEPHQWNPEGLLWPVKVKDKPDLIFFDPPYFKKQENQYTKDSISSLSRKEYLKFFKELFPLFREYTKAHTRIAFMNADWRNFQGIAAVEEDPGQSIFLSDYIDLLKDSGWEITHIVDCPLSTQRFLPNMVSHMQKNRTLGIIRRSLIIGRKK